MFNQTQNILIEHINHCKLETNMNILAENHNETSRFNVSNINGSIVSEKDIEDIELRANSLTKLVESASMYSEAAKKVNSIGLQLNLLKEDTEPEQKSRKEEFDKVSKSEDTKETADYINKAADAKDASVTKKNTKTETCEIDKKKVSEAVDCFDELPDSIANIIQKASSLRDDSFNLTTMLNSKIESDNFSDITDILNLEAAKINLLEETFDKFNKVVVEFNNLENKVLNSCKIVTCASKYNPRAIKESMEETVIRESYLDTEMSYALDNMYASVSDSEVSTNEAGESLKAKIQLSNEKFLKKYAEDAKKSSCIGIEMKKWYVSKDIEKKYKECLRECDKAFKINYSSSEELKKRYKELRGKIILLFGDSANNKINMQQIDKQLTKTRACEDQGPHTVTKKDVITAIGFLKTCTKELEKIQSELNTAAINTTGREVATGMVFGVGGMMYRQAGASIKNTDTLIGSKDKKYEARIKQMDEDTKNYLKYNYLRAKKAQIKILQQQSRVVIMKAARCKVTEADIKELEEFESMIDEFANML